MARASTYTLIPLDRMAEHLGINPWHFNGCYSDKFPFAPSCADDWYQHNWQAVGKLSREALAQALVDAERVTEGHLGFSPLPRWYEETARVTPYHQIERRNIVNSQGRSKSVSTSHGYVFEVGIRASSLIGTPNIAYSDTDADGITDLATITFATTVTDTEELRVYFPGKSGDDTWEIRPLTSVSIAAGVATITFRKWMCVLEALQEAQPTPDDPQVGVDASLDANFLVSVDVYRVYTDPSTQATLLYEPKLSCSTAYDHTTQTGALVIRDERLGTLAYHAATWDSTNLQWDVTGFTNYPDKVTLYYRAGKRDTSLPMPTRDMDRQYERKIAFYALSLLDTELCGCDNTRNIWQWQTRDLAKNDGEVSYNMPWGSLDNPLGTSFAAMRLWKAIQLDHITAHQRRW